MNEILVGCLTLLGLIRPSGFEVWQIREIQKLTATLEFDSRSTSRGLTKSSVVTMNEIKARLDRSASETPFKFMKIWFIDFNKKLVHLPQIHQWREDVQARNRIADLNRFLNHPAPKELWEISESASNSSLEKLRLKVATKIEKALPFLIEHRKVLSRQDYILNHQQKIIGDYPDLAHATEVLLYSIDKLETETKTQTVLDLALHSADSIWATIRRRQDGLIQNIDEQIDQLVKTLETIHDVVTKIP